MTEARTVNTVSPARLVLWDIDLTLVDLRGLGGRWYTTALANVAGVTLETMPSFPGRTELGITTELLTQHGIEPTREVVERVWAELVRLVAETAPLDRHGRALPGTAEVLAALAALGERTVVQSLVTGNLPEVARHKLDAFGLGQHLDLAIGGYGTVSAHRPDLVAHAAKLAGEKHAPFAPEHVVVVGDTPLDVTAALEHGAVAIGVGTGVFTADELRAAGAHTAFDDLSDTAAVVATLTGESASR